MLQYSICYKKTSVSIGE
uniref:Uncharacterized protein n=1 Tax=Rhizophora mucronata TaxID=61149 RepID=A0A2P2PYS4_RHIMU